MCRFLRVRFVGVTTDPVRRSRPWGRRTAAFADPADNTWEIAQILS